MTAPLDKLASLELALAREKGDFEFFGVFLRDTSLGKWDLIVAAPWLKANDRESLKVIVDSMQRSLSPRELLDFSRVVVLDKGDPFLEKLLGMFSVEHSQIEVEDIDLLDVSFRRAFIITAKRWIAGKRRRNRNSNRVN